MDLDTITEKIMLLSSANQSYIEQLKSLNSEINIDDINDNPDSEKNTNIVITADTLQSHLSKAGQIKILAKKIQDNVSAINSLIAKAQIDPSFFDNSEQLAQYRAKCTLNDIPDAAQHDAAMPLSATFLNIGYMKWTNTNVEMHTVISNDDLGYMNHIVTELQPTDSVDIGESINFSLNVVAPTTPDRYCLTLSMYQNGQPFDFVVTKYIYVV